FLVQGIAVRILLGHQLAGRVAFGQRDGVLITHFDQSLLRQTDGTRIIVLLQLAMPGLHGACELPNGWRSDIEVGLRLRGGYDQIEEATGGRKQNGSRRCFQERLWLRSRRDRTWS